MPNFETVEVSTDLLVVGGVFAACGAATEAAYWAKKHGLEVTLVDKAALDRSGAVAMGLSAINNIYDKIGLISLIIILVLTSPVAFLAFSHRYTLALMSMIFWGAVMGIHETIMRAAIADLIQIERRGFAYSVFNTIYGGAWFLGSMLMGVLYDFSISYLIIFVVLMEIVSIPALLMVRNET